MGISEIIMIMLVYAGLFLYLLLPVSSKIMVFVKMACLMILFGFISTIIWFTYKGEEFHINSHSGYEPISFTAEAIVMIIGFSVYSVILFSISMLLYKKWDVKSLFNHRGR